jgi:hypothetical protein
MKPMEQKSGVHAFEQQPRESAKRGTGVSLVIAGVPPGISIRPIGPIRRSALNVGC